ncbi:hypothetical protein [Subtercola sp. Z020]|uniref:hypothetical protein n=1 Tax=Subtercola sp. Z020 TaxID=2080582 RepID=UPI0011AFF182|nr:hypothetical protein [Subtercola sp. Z020]
MQLSFRWSVGGVAVPDTGGTIYKITPADVGKTITLTVTGTADGYLTESRTSIATRPVVGVFTAAPTPTVSGTAKVGQTLTADATGWTPEHVSIAYQWLRNGTPITGATAKTYRLTSADAGKRIIVQVTGTKTGYATQSKQSASVVVAP